MLTVCTGTSDIILYHVQCQKAIMKNTSLLKLSDYLYSETLHSPAVLLR